MRPLTAIAALVVLAGCLENGAPPGADETSLPTKTPSGPTPTSTNTTTTPRTPTPGTLWRPPETSSLAIRTLGEGGMSDARERVRGIATNDESYQELWARVREDPTQPAPAVDLTRETVVAVASEGRPNGCWSLRVTNASAEQVEVTTYSPPPEIMCAAVIGYPWHVVAVEGAQWAFAFVEHEAQGPPPS